MSKCEDDLKNARQSLIDAKYSMMSAIDVIIKYNDELLERGE